MWLCAAQLCPVWPQCCRRWSRPLYETFWPSMLSVTSLCKGGKSDRRYKHLSTPLLAAGASGWREQTCKTCNLSFFFVLTFLPSVAVPLVNWEDMHDDWTLYYKKVAAGRSSWIWFWDATSKLSKRWFLQNKGTVSFWKMHRFLLANGFSSAYNKTVENCSVCDVPADQASVWISVRDELSFPVEFQQSLAAEAEAKRKHQVRVSSCTSIL